MNEKLHMIYTQVTIYTEYIQTSGWKINFKSQKLQKIKEKDRK